jgi:hypothetical protein
LRIDELNHSNNYIQKIFIKRLKAVEVIIKKYLEDLINKIKKPIPYTLLVIIIQNIDLNGWPPKRI